MPLTTVASLIAWTGLFSAYASKPWLFRASALKPCFSNGNLLPIPHRVYRNKGGQQLIEYNPGEAP